MQPCEVADELVKQFRKKGDCLAIPARLLVACRSSVEGNTTEELVLGSALGGRASVGVSQRSVEGKEEEEPDV